MNYDYDYDEALVHLGELGRWSLVNQGLLWAPPIIAGMMVLQYSITGARLHYNTTYATVCTSLFLSLYMYSGLEPEEFRCRIPICDPESGGQYNSVAGNIYPLDEDGETDYCRYYPLRDNATSEVCHIQQAFDFTAKPVQCESEEGNFIYDDFEMATSVATEWDLVCDRQFMVIICSLF